MDQIKFLLPEITLILLSFALLFNSLIDQIDKRITNKILLIIGSLVSIILLLNGNPQGYFLNDTFENNTLTNTIKVLLVSGTLLSLLLISNSKSEQFKNYFNEYCFLLILSLVGGMIVVSSREFLTMIISFEILKIFAGCLGLRLLIIFFDVMIESLFCSRLIALKTFLT